jgi:hypothetical protein
MRRSCGDGRWFAQAFHVVAALLGERYVWRAILGLLCTAVVELILRHCLLDWLVDWSAVC